MLCLFAKEEEAKTKSERRESLEKVGRVDLLLLPDFSLQIFDTTVSLFYTKGHGMPKRRASFKDLGEKAR